MKKKSHRKDVIIARVIFGVVCLSLVVVIAGAAIHIRENYVKTHHGTQEDQTQDLAGESVNPVLPPATAPSECLIRTSLMATHTEQLLDEAMDIIKEVLSEYE